MERPYRKKANKIKDMWSDDIDFCCMGERNPAFKTCTIYGLQPCNIASIQMYHQSGLR